jgi:hypothetical protein
MRGSPNADHKVLLWGFDTPQSAGSLQHDKSQWLRQAAGFGGDYTCNQSDLPDFSPQGITPDNYILFSISQSTVANAM